MYVYRFVNYLFDTVEESVSCILIDSVMCCLMLLSIDNVVSKSSLDYLDKIDAWLIIE